MLFIVSGRHIGAYKKYGIKGLEKFRIEQLEDEEGCRIQMDTEIYSCYEKDFFLTIVYQAGLLLR